MYSEDFIQNYLEFLASINTRYFPMLLIIQGLWILVLTVMITSNFVSYTRKKDQLLKWIVGLIQCYGGIYMLLGYSENKDMAMSGAGFIPFGIIFIYLFNKLDIQFKMSKDRALQVAGVIFMVAGLYFYQIIGILTGFKYPNIVMFGVECPAYLFMGGLFIACLPTINRYFALIFFLFSMISSASAVAVGATFDLVYLASAVTGLIFTIKYWNANKGTQTATIQ